MSQPFDRRLADDPPVRPERVMPAVALVVTGLAVALVLVGLASLWPALAGVLPGTASGLAVGTLVFGALAVLTLVAASMVSRRVAPNRPQ
ncbi:hypothetical protein [Natronomonas amylolytica]|uniref:hypothetical protein n=1 Tax=Natronomonas amylolytica TaxID=3108498 RepID=UPI00300A96D6